MQQKQGRSLSRAVTSLICEIIFGDGMMQSFYVHSKKVSLVEKKLFAVGAKQDEPQTPKKLPL